MFSGKPSKRSAESSAAVIKPSQNCGSVDGNDNQRGNLHYKKHFILLEKDEREALEAIRDNPELLDGRKKRATVLLMADIGPDGSPVSRKQIHETTGLDLRTIGTIVEQAMDRVPIEVVMGVSREGQGRGQRRKRKLSPEEEQIAADFSTGKFTKVLLAERYGVSQSKVFFVIKEQEGFSR